ncbi:MAG: PfkB family carbohydrate kinase [Candidatus Roizmanbacteria bacterium]|nr:PfkB family carbohydrate kinase [Candidatus Roizmanbacteria bacterium]
MKIYVAGSVAYDEIMDFPHHFKDYFHPEKLHQINVSFAVSDLAKHLGGITTNIVYALRNTTVFYANSKSETLNTKQMKQNSKIEIYPVAAVGRDGGELLDFFKKNKIDCTYVQKDEKLYTATGKVITDKNDNQIWGFYYGACALNPKLETLNSKQIKQNSKSETGNDFWVIAATHERPFSTALRFVINNKLPYMFDPGMTLTWIKDALLKKGVMNAQYVIGNDYEIAMIEKRLGTTVKELVEKGINVITTLGEKGVRYDGSGVISTEVEKSQRLRSLDSKKALNSLEMTIKAVKLKKVVDPTGAGDAWRGGFVGALVAGKSLRECLVMGNVMASFAVEHVGTVEYTVNEVEIKRRIKTLNSKI